MCDGKTKGLALQYMVHVMFDYNGKNAHISGYKSDITGNMC